MHTSIDPSTQHQTELNYVIRDSYPTTITTFSQAASPPVAPEKSTAAKVRPPRNCSRTVRGTNERRSLAALSCRAGFLGVLRRQACVYGYGCGGMLVAEARSGHHKSNRLWMWGRCVGGWLLHALRRAYHTCTGQKGSFLPTLVRRQCSRPNSS